MRFLKFLTLALFLAFVACTSHKTGQKVRLALNLQKGQTYKLKSNATQIMQQTVHNMKQNITTYIKSVTSYYVKERQNDKFNCELTVDKMQFKLTAPHSVITFNSENPNKTDNIYDRIYYQFTGKKFTMIIDRYGKVDTLQGLDSLGQHIINGLELKSPMLKAQLIEDFKGMFGNKMFKSNLELLTCFFPKKPVHIGESWSNAIDLSAAVPATFDNTWKLTDIDSTQAIIKGNALIESINGGAPVHFGNMAVSYEVQGDQTSEIHIQPKSGWILFAKINSHVTGTIKVEKNTQLPNGLNIPFDLKTESEYHSL